MHTISFKRETHKTLKTRIGDYPAFKKLRVAALIVSVSPTHKTIDTLLDTSAAIRTDLPVCIQWTVARWTHIAYLRIANGAHDEVTVNGCRALGANTIV